MPSANYCKKCKVETPPGEMCPRCGTRLTKAGERLSFRVERVPMVNWFVWNSLLRVVVPVFTLLFSGTLLVEGFASGSHGIQPAMVQGFFWMLLGLFGAMLFLALLVFWVQGPDVIHYVLDAKAARAYIYVHQPNAMQLWARLMTRANAEALAQTYPEAVQEGFTLVRHTGIAWAQVSRFAVWPETATVLLYRPVFWQALSIHCEPGEYSQLEALVRRKVPKRKRSIQKKR